MAAADLDPAHKFSTSGAAEQFIQEPQGEVEFVVSGRDKRVKVFKGGWDVGDIRFEYGSYRVLLWRNAQSLLFSAGFKTITQAKEAALTALSTFTPSVANNIEGFEKFRAPQKDFDAIY